MISVCIYCGKNKAKALDECEECLKTPGSHRDRIHSIVMCFSEEDPHLNFLSLDEVEELRASIISGSGLKISPELFSVAEEAYDAVRSLDGPQALKHFSKVSQPIMAIVALIFILFVLLG